MDAKPYAIIGREPQRSQSLRNNLSSLLEQLSIECIPFIDTQPVPFDLPKHEGLPLFLFTSPRAVEMYFNSKRLPNPSSVASIGQATTKALEKQGIIPFFTSQIENAQGMAPKLLQFLQTNQLAPHIIQPTSNIAGHYLHDYFVERGFEYSLLTTYQVTPSVQLTDKLQSYILAPEWVIFYSPSGVRAWSEASPFSSFPPAISIGPTTTKELKKMGARIILETPTPHEDDIIKTIKNFYKI